MTSQAQKQLSLLQRTLYEKAFEEAHSVMAGGSPRILEYAERFEDGLPTEFLRAGLKDVLESLRAPSIVMYGDFHTLKQSQKGLVRLIRSYIERFGKTNLVLALESFRASDQPVLDQYMDARISDQEFLSRTNYHRNWGFSWTHYKMVLDCAKEHGIPVVGINSRNGGKDYLAFRDQFAARKLVATAKKYEKSTILCMIGESHLADQHLPHYLDEELQRCQVTRETARILTNVDKYYFKLQAMSPHLNTEYLKIKDNLFCIINTPPWMKWQSYALWEEMRSLEGSYSLKLDDENDADDDDMDYTEETFDLDYQFFTVVKNLANFLGVTVQESALSGFNIYCSNELDFDEAIEREGLEDPKALSSILERISLDGVYFLTKTRTILLADFSMNNIAEAASRFLHSILCHAPETSENVSEAFTRRVLDFAVGMVGSKVLNPRRKCPDLAAFRSFAEHNRRRRLHGYAKTKREIAKAVVDYHGWIATCSFDEGTPAPKLPRSFTGLDSRSDYELSRAIGMMLGLKLYKKTIAGQLPSNSIKLLFENSPTNWTQLWEAFSRLYHSVLIKV